MGSETGDSLSILTWNVAGWAPTCALISSHYGDLTAYLKRLQCDVFCIQESKVITSQLDSAPQNSLGARNSPGWQSYWAFNRGKKKGFNGVNTFVREGSNSLSVRSATQDVLGEKDPDDEGLVPIDGAREGWIYLRHQGLCTCQQNLRRYEGGCRACCRP